MIIRLNGEPREVAENTTVAALVRLLGRDPDGRGVAVAVAGEVVPRARWGERVIDGGAAVEVVNAVGGG